MRGLIIREMTLAKKQLMTIFVMVIGILAVHMMFIISLKIGNLSHMTLLDKLELQAGIGNCYYVELFALLTGISAFSTNIFNDFKNGWHSFARTLPGGIKNSIMAKYICVAVTGVVLFALGCVMSIIITLANGNSIDGTSWCFMITILLAMWVFCSIYIPLAYFVKEQNRAVGIIMTPAFLLSIVYMVKIEDIENELELGTNFINMKNQVITFITDNIAWLCIGTLVLLGLSMLVSVKIMQRGK